MTDSEITLQPGDTLTVRVPAAEPVPEPEPPGEGPSGIAVPAVKAGWKRVGFSHFDDDIPAPWTGDRQGALLHRTNGYLDTSKRGKYSNKRAHQKDSILHLPMWVEGGQHYMSCPMNKAPNPTNDASTAPRSLRVEECMKISGTAADFKIAHMLAKYGAVRLQEIDWPENRLASRTVDPGAWLHLLDGGSGKHFKAGDPGALYEWHRYAIEFVSGKYVQVEFDGKVIGRAEGPGLIGTDRVHWIIQNETAIGVALTGSGETDVMLDWVTIEVPA